MKINYAKLKRCIVTIDIRDRHGQTRRGYKFVAPTDEEELYDAVQIASKRKFKKLVAWIIKNSNSNYFFK